MHDSYPETLRVKAATWLLETLLDLSSERNIAEPFVNTYLHEIEEVKNGGGNGYLVTGWNGIDHIKYQRVSLYHQLYLLIHQE